VSRGQSLQFLAVWNAGEQILSLKTCSTVPHYLSDL
jgi:hypothetical protein